MLVRKRSRYQEERGRRSRGPKLEGIGHCRSVGSSHYPEAVTSLSRLPEHIQGAEEDMRRRSSVRINLLRLGRRGLLAGRRYPIVHDPVLVSRTMVKDVLREKRLDGVSAALTAFAEECSPGARQTRQPGGPRRPDHSGHPRGGAGDASSGSNSRPDRAPPA